MYAQPASRIPPGRALVVWTAAAVGFVGIAALGGRASIVLYAAYVGAGAFLVARRPTQPIGWLLVLMGVGLASALLPVPATVGAALSGDLPPGTIVAMWGNGAGWALVFVGLIGLALAFPEGHLPDGRSQPVAMALLAGGVAYAALIASNPVFNIQLAGAPTWVDVPNPLMAIPSPLASYVPDTGTLYPVAFGFVAVALAGLLLRYRTARGLLRLQYRWLVWSLVLVVVTTAAWVIATTAVPVDTIGVTLAFAMLAYAAVPVAIAVAVLRYRLYDIDRIVSRTVGWATATALVVAVFAGAVVGLQGLLGHLTQGDALAVAASTLLAFALFQPVRRRVQRAVDRQFDRPRLAVAATIGAYAAQLRHEVDLVVIEREMVDTVDAALRPAAAGVWLRPVRSRLTTAPTGQ